MKHVFCVAIVLLLCVASAWAEQNEKLSESNRAIISEKRQKISAEIAQLQDHPWAGQYYFGDGLGTNVTLTLAPENGFTITWFGCLGLYDQNHGTVAMNGNRIKFSFAFDVESGYTGNYASEYMPIRWGERLYLIPPGEIVQFCNAINSGNEPRRGPHGRFFLRRDDWKKEAPGKPELPKELMPYLLDKPVDVAIVSIKNTREGRIGKIATVVIDKGKEAGLLPGMELRVVRPESVYQEVKLTHVGEKQSEGEYIYAHPWEEKSLFKTPAPARGWQLSTRPSWRRDRGEQEKHDEPEQEKRGFSIFNFLLRQK